MQDQPCAPAGLEVGPRQVAGPDSSCTKPLNKWISKEAPAGLDVRSRKVAGPALQGAILCQGVHPGGAGGNGNDGLAVCAPLHYDARARLYDSYAPVPQARPQPWTDRRHRSHHDTPLLRRHVAMSQHVVMSQHT